MSTIPLRIDSVLVNLARTSGATMERTPTAQIEFWAKLGRVMEVALAYDSLVAVKEMARVEDIDALIALSITPDGKELARAEIARHQGPVYSADPTSPDVLIEQMPDGVSRRGKFVNRRFVALAAAEIVRAG